jgi:hypothetical protein
MKAKWGENWTPSNPILQSAVSNGLLTGYTSPAFLWPRPEFQTPIAARRKNCCRNMTPFTAPFWPAVFPRRHWD